MVVHVQEMSHSAADLKLDLPKSPSNDAMNKIKEYRSVLSQYLKTPPRFDSDGNILTPPVKQPAKQTSTRLSQSRLNYIPSPLSTSNISSATTSRESSPFASPRNNSQRVTMLNNEEFGTKLLR